MGETLLKSCGAQLHRGKIYTPTHVEREKTVVYRLPIKEANASRFPISEALSGIFCIAFQAECWRVHFVTKQHAHEDTDQFLQGVLSNVVSCHYPVPNSKIVTKSHYEKTKLLILILLSNARVA